MSHTSPNSSQHGLSESGGYRKTSRRAASNEPEHDLGSLERITADIRRQSAQRKLITGHTISPLTNNADQSSKTIDTTNTFDRYSNRGNGSDKEQLGQERHSNLKLSPNEDTSLIISDSLAVMIIGPPNRPASNGSSASERQLERGDYQQPSTFHPAKSTISTILHGSGKSQTADKTIVAPPAEATGTRDIGAGTTVHRYPRVSPPVGGSERESQPGRMEESGVGSQSGLAPTGALGPSQEYHPDQTAINRYVTRGGEALVPFPL